MTFRRSIPASRQLIGLAPRQRGAIDLSALRLPRGHERLQRCRLAGAGRCNRQSEATTLPEMLYGASLCRAVAPSKVQSGLLDLLPQQPRRQRCAAILGCSPCQLDERLLLAFVQSCRHADNALAWLLAPDQRCLLTVLPHAVIAHLLRHGQQIASHVARSHINQPPCSGNLQIPMRQDGFVFELIARNGSAVS